MKIGIIDADLIGRDRHNFPNLACMKISSFHKGKGHTVSLIHYDDIQGGSLFSKHFDKVYICKVFTDTKVLINESWQSFVEYGGTGFFFDKAKPLSDEIEHSMPDYALYDKWIAEKIRNGEKPAFYKYFTDYSIGYTTRGCFRKCGFCINKNETKITVHSPLKEFVDNKRKKICLLDDNVLGCNDWKSILSELIQTKKSFQYKQGLDIRLLTDEKARYLSLCKYEGDFTFAFDNVEDKRIIIDKIKIFKKYLPNVIPKLYVLCAYDKNNIYDQGFWINDIINMLERLKILMQYECLPFLMRFEKWSDSPYSSFYADISTFANVPSVFKKQTINEYIPNRHGKGKEAKGIAEFAKKQPAIANKYFNLKYSQI